MVSRCGNLLLSMTRDEAHAVFLLEVERCRLDGEMMLVKVIQAVEVVLWVVTYNHQLGLLVAAHVENVVQPRDIALECVIDLGVGHFCCVFVLFFCFSIRFSFVVTGMTYAIWR